MITYLDETPNETRIALTDLAKRNVETAGRAERSESQPAAHPHVRHLGPL